MPEKNKWKTVEIHWLDLVGTADSTQIFLPTEEDKRLSYNFKDFISLCMFYMHIKIDLKMSFFKH